MYETAKETMMYRSVLWTLWERERVGRFGRMTLKHVKYHVRNELPVRVRCTILDTWGQKTHLLLVCALKEKQKQTLAGRDVNDVAASGAGRAATAPLPGVRPCASFNFSFQPKNMNLPMW